MLREVEVLDDYTTPDQEGFEAVARAADEAAEYVLLEDALIHEAFDLAQAA